MFVGVISPKSISTDIAKENEAFHTSHFITTIRTLDVGVAIGTFDNFCLSGFDQFLKLFLRNVFADCKFHYFATILECYIRANVPIFERL